MPALVAPASPPAARISSTTCCAGAADVPAPSRDVPLSLTTTSAPSAANASACARPSPPPAPVTMTTRPSQMPIDSPLADSHVFRVLPEVGLAAVGHQRRAGDVPRVVAKQERDRLADVVLEVADAA